MGISRSNRFTWPLGPPALEARTRLNFILLQILQDYKTFFNAGKCLEFESAFLVLNCSLFGMNSIFLI